MTEVSNFIRSIVDEDIKNRKHQTIVTRFPPEPNGYLHIGHAKAICLNFGLANDFNGKCNLRFDDTNPEKESTEYVNSIEQSIKWLGFNWDGEVKYASDYFGILYEYARFFIRQGLAYVCDLSAEEMHRYRGSLTEVGKNSPYRERSIQDNLDLFTRMHHGEFADGTKTLRLKIDMNSPNLNLRDPVIYRIKRAHHIRTLDKWCIYPMYDYTHCISDALEGISHSCCSLEFEDHRPLYDWVIHHLFAAGLINYQPQQIEFSRLQLQYTITSKRKLNQLVELKLVSGWDDPRMPTLLGMRRRGYTPEGIKLFITRCGISKSPNIAQIELLENSIREDLEKVAPRIMAVLKPLKVVLTNYRETTTFSREADFHPQNPQLGKRVCQLTQEIYIEADDFQEIANPEFQRLCLNGEVRLRHSYVIRCDNVVKDGNGNIIELQCSIDHNTLGKNPEGRKVKGVIHWVSSTLAVNAQIRIYQNLFICPDPDNVKDKNFLDLINSQSIEISSGFIEPCSLTSVPESRYQFERLGYFVVDRFDSSLGKLVFNKIVSLRDTRKPK